MSINYTDMIQRISNARKHLDGYCEKLENKYGEPYYRAEFENSDDLEQFFVDILMNTKGFSSKVIGKTLLIFDKNHG